jgi:hypothetical protein
MLRESFFEGLLSRPDIELLLIFAADCSFVDNRRLKAVTGQRAEFWFSAVAFWFNRCYSILLAMQ